MQVLLLLFCHGFFLVCVVLDPVLDEGSRLVQDGVGLGEFPLQQVEHGFAEKEKHSGVVGSGHVGEVVAGTQETHRRVVILLGGVDVGQLE